SGNKSQRDRDRVTRILRTTSAKPVGGGAGSIDTDSSGWGRASREEFPSPAASGSRFSHRERRGNKAFPVQPGHQRRALPKLHAVVQAFGGAGRGAGSENQVQRGRGTTETLSTTGARTSELDTRRRRGGDHKQSAFDWWRCGRYLLYQQRPIEEGTC